MPSLPLFLVRLIRATQGRDAGPGGMHIVVRRRYAYLQEELQAAFQGDDDVRIIIDRRHAERRQRAVPMEPERRRAERRREADEIAAVTFSG